MARRRRSRRRGELAWYRWIVTALLSLTSEVDDIVTNPSGSSIAMGPGAAGTAWVQRAHRRTIAIQSAGTAGCVAHECMRYISTFRASRRGAVIQAFHGEFLTGDTRPRDLSLYNRDKQASFSGVAGTFQF
jgi:hypothetical protein